MVNLIVQCPVVKTKLHMGLWLNGVREIKVLKGHFELATLKQGKQREEEVGIVRTWRLRRDSAELGLRPGQMGLPVPPKADSRPVLGLERTCLSEPLHPPRRRRVVLPWC